MADAKFERVSRSDTPLYGPRKLLLCGFSADAQPKFAAVLKMADMADIPKVWVTADQVDRRLAELMEMAADTGAGTSSGMQRAIIVAGITEKDLHRLMNVCRKTGMKQSLWAVLTPTSETWTLRELLTELRAEREAMRPGKRKK